MWVKHLVVKNCRLINEEQIELSPEFNIIFGENAAGKTSLLEALSILSKGRSFRTSHITDVITHGKQSVIVSAQIRKNKTEERIGIEKTSKKTKIRINKQDVFSQAELSSYLPVTVVHPASIELITGSPNNRRSFLDWLAFYLYDDFHQNWKSYQHVLKQRNICLKDQQHRYGLEKWTEELVKLHPIVSNYRHQSLESLKPQLKLITDSLLPSKKIELEFLSGIPREISTDPKSLSDFYAEREDNDLKRKRTVYGAHRANIKINIEGKPALEYASRGQLKLLAISLLLAQSNTIKEDKNNQGILLIDDLAAELDSVNKNQLISYISKLNQQILITSTKKFEIENIESKMFHVKHGKILEN